MVADGPASLGAVRLLRLAVGDRIALQLGGDHMCTEHVSECAVCDDVTIASGHLTLVHLGPTVAAASTVLANSGGWVELADWEPLGEGYRHSVFYTGVPLLSLATGRATAAINGTYMVTVALRLDGVPPGFLRVVVALNGAPTPNSGLHAVRSGPAADYEEFGVTGLMEMTEDDFVSVWVYADGGHSYTVHRQSGFSCALLEVPAGFAAELTGHHVVSGSEWAEVGSWDADGGHHARPHFGQRAWDTGRGAVFMLEEVHGVGFDPAAGRFTTLVGGPHFAAASIRIDAGDTEYLRLAVAVSGAPLLARVLKAFGGRQSETIDSLRAHGCVNLQPGEYLSVFVQGQRTGAETAEAEWQDTYDKMVTAVNAEIAAAQDATNFPTDARKQTLAAIAVNEMVAARDAESTARLQKVAVFGSTRYGIGDHSGFSAARIESTTGWAMDLAGGFGPNRTVEQAGWVEVSGWMSACTTADGTALEGSLCQLPFVYRGTTYNECTDRNNAWPWCYTDPAAEFGGGGRFGRCICGGLYWHRAGYDQPAGRFTPMLAGPAVASVAATVILVGADHAKQPTAGLFRVAVALNGVADPGNGLATTRGRVAADLASFTVGGLMLLLPGDFLSVSVYSQRSDSYTIDKRSQFTCIVLPDMPASAFGANRPSPRERVELGSWTGHSLLGGVQPLLDPHLAPSEATGRFTAPQAGIYLATAALTVELPAVFPWLRGVLAVNAIPDPDSGLSTVKLDVQPGLADFRLVPTHRSGMLREHYLKS